MSYKFGTTRGTFHVDDFGAKPRSFYDASTITNAERTANVTAINAALAAAKVGLPPGTIGPGGTVYMGPGVYYTNDAVGYDLTIDVNIGVTLQGLGPFPTMISSNNTTKEVFKLYTTSGNIRMFYMKDIGLYGGRTGLSLVRACYNRFENIFFWGSHQMALQGYLGSDNVFEKCYFTDTSQFGGSAAMLVSCADRFLSCMFGESCGGVFVYDGNLSIEGGYGYGMYYRGTSNYTDYWTTPGSPVDVSLAFWAGDEACFLGSNSVMNFNGFRLAVAKKFLSLSGVQDLIMNGCQIIGSDTTIGGPGLFQGFIDFKQSFGASALNISGGQFIWRSGTNGYFIRETAALLHDSVIQTQLVQEGTAVITDLGTSAPALLNPGGENNLVIARTFVR